MTPLPKATVFTRDDAVPFVVLETPSEVAEIVRRADLNRSMHGDESDMVQLRLGNASQWNGKPLYVRARDVVAISPPMDVIDDH